MHQYEEQEMAIREELTPQELLIRWKEQYGAIYQVVLNDINFIFREISEREVRMLDETLEDNVDKEDLICKMAVLDPLIFDWSDEIYGGFVQALSIKILDNSGLTQIGAADLEQRIKVATNEMESFDKQMPCIIKECFPEYEIDEITGWGRTKQIDYYARAVWILKNLRGIVLTSGEEEQ